MSWQTELPWWSSGYDVHPGMQETRVQSPVEPQNFSVRRKTQLHYFELKAHGRYQGANLVCVLLYGHLHSTAPLSCHFLPLRTS